MPEAVSEGVPLKVPVAASKVMPLGRTVSVARV